MVLTLDLSEHQHLPIGVFDSGVGGLTVLKALQAKCPYEHFIYLGDTARLPYGTKSADTVIHYAVSCAELLKKRGIKLLVIACNTATSVALEALIEDFYPIPVVGVIQPGALAACQASLNHCITVLATEGTVRSHAYREAIHEIKADAMVTEHSCALMVSLAEEGWTKGPLVEAIIAELIQPTLSSQSDTLVLGCTHFPVLKEAIQQVVGERMTIIDSAHTIAQSVNDLLIRHQLSTPNRSVSGHCHFLATDNLQRFKKMASIFLEAPIEDEQIELVDIF